MGTDSNTGEAADENTLVKLHGALGPNSFKTVSLLSGI